MVSVLDELPLDVLYPPLNAPKTPPEQLLRTSCSIMITLIDETEEYPCPDLKLWIEMSIRLAIESLGANAAPEHVARLVNQTFESELKEYVAHWQVDEESAVSIAESIPWLEENDETV